ncbi:hypothetical protein WOLCODRAFT_82526 [Wolfiporia cocos MD-104 SS10]|uniref:RNase H type-1 domain-containing protein n=1 Tax=Wolfiporia cocos (strain MD-104) TaxID=742152 RepID=A0A2H3J9R7_WOLCO|nr:hypothetical protein WOLCODRAFT_82526 [Wolfiporia cocos MD-104 SS10]
MKQECTTHHRHIQHLLNVITTNPDHLAIYTNGSSCTPHYRCKPHTGAAFLVTHLGKHIHNEARGLGPQATSFDAELFSAALAANRILDVLPTHVHRTTHIHYFIDNTAAIDKVYDMSKHPGQLNSILFHDATDKLLSTYPDISVTIHWCPSHKGIPGNEHVDQLAHAAVLLPHSIPSTITWLRSTAHRRTLQHWQQEWVSKNCINSSRYALTTLPTYTLHLVLQKFTETRHIQSHLLQCITGHAFMGKYYQRFIPNESPLCPCDNTTIQTRRHVLLHCPIHNHARSFLREASPSLQLSFILSTVKGWWALISFLKHSCAFIKQDGPQMVFDPG